MTLEQQILDFLRSRKKGKRKFSDIQNNIKADDTDLSVALSNLEKEYLIFLNNNHQYETREEAGIYEGKIYISSNGMGYFDLDDNNSFRIEERNQKGAFHGDRVLIKVNNDKETAKVIEILERTKDKVVGTYYKSGKGLKLELDDEKLRNRHIKFIQSDITVVEGLKVLFNIEQYSDPLTLKIEKVIGHKDDPGIDILAILLEKGIDPEFPEEVLDEANSIPQNVLESEKEGRTDLTKDITITIDGDDSKDFDDAVSIVKNEDNYVVKVSIADVSHYVKEDSPLDIEARERGTSTYAVDTVVPMLPHVLSNGICSLNPYEERLTITCEMVIDFNGVVKDYKLYPSFIKSTERMTYNNVNKIYAGDKELQDKYSNLVEMLFDLKDVANLVRKRRVDKGAIEFGSNEADITVDENGYPIDIKAVDRGIGERVIEDLMIVTNVCVAEFMKWQEFPCIYRVHEKPQSKKINDFIQLSASMGHKLILGKSSIYPNEIQHYLNSIEKVDAYPVLSMLLLRCMQKAKYENVCKGHFGLAEENYLHFTSPIRRYPDLMVHRMLRKYSFEALLDEKQREKDNEKCGKYAESSSERERAAQDAEYEADDMKKAEYMLDHIGEEYEGIISSVQSYGFYVMLDNTIEGLVRLRDLSDDYYDYDSFNSKLVGAGSGKTIELGEKVRVKVLDANKEARTVDFELVEKES